MGTCGSCSLGTSASPFELRQGSTLRLVARATRTNDYGEVVPIDLSDPPRTGRAELRRSVEEMGSPIATLTVTNRTQTGDNRGVADVVLGASVSEAPQIAPGLYVIDVEFPADADAEDVVASAVYYVRVKGEVTKS